jgi:hypothetical protein
MRRTIITAVATLALAVPGVALASHQDEHQHGEHQRGGNEQHQSRFDCHAAGGGATREDARDRDRDDDRGHDGQSNSGPGDGRHGALSGRDGHDNDGRDDDAEDEAKHCTSTTSKVRSF